jgi:hypothetical protein
MALAFAQELPAAWPETMPVLALSPPAPFPASLAQLAELGAAVGLTRACGPVALTLREPWTSYRIGDRELAVHTHSGAIRLRQLGSPERPPFELTKRDATRVATALCAQLGIGKEELQVSSITHLCVAGRTVDGQDLGTRVLDAEVTFRRALDGIPTVGPGGTTSVRVAGDRSAVRFDRIARPVQSAVAPVRIQPPDKLRRAFKRFANTKRGDVVVTSAGLGYFELGINDRQSFLQPAYVLVYEVRDGDVGYRSAYVDHAGDRVFERLAAPRRFSTTPRRVADAVGSRPTAARRKPAAAVEAERRAKS